jgi:uncharacterized RDD family membrane protein YckC
VNAQPLPRYAGLVTRTAAFVIDAAIVNGVALIVAGSLSLALSIFGASLDDLPSAVKIVFGVGGWIALNLVYFVGSWTLTGQSAGMRVMSIRVERVDGGRLSVLRAAIRVIGLVLAAIPLFAGYLVILVNDRRRGLQDWLADSVVVFDYERDGPWGGLWQRRLASERHVLAGAEGTPNGAGAISPKTDDADDPERVRIETRSQTNGGIDGSA